MNSNNLTPFELLNIAHYEYIEFTLLKDQLPDCVILNDLDFESMLKVNGCLSISNGSLHDCKVYPSSQMNAGEFKYIKE